MTQITAANESIEPVHDRMPLLQERDEIKQWLFEDSLTEIDLDSLSDDFEEQNETIESILEFLINWLVNHILKVDMLYVPKESHT